MPGSLSLRAHSIAVILDNQHPSGAYIASPNFSVYGYSWFRDGAFIAEAMRVAGEQASAERFHAWAADVVNARSAQIESLIARSVAGDEPTPDEHLHCRYNLDGSTSTDDWTNFQLDGFGTWLWAVTRVHADDAPAAVRLAAQSLIAYLTQFWRAPSFDWWEESPGHIHVSSVGCIAVGLDAIAAVPWIDADARRLASATASEIRSAILAQGVVDGHLAKWFGGTGVDASVLALVAPLGFVASSHEVAIRTVAEIRDHLANPGVHRHLDDTYFGGGQWLLLTAVLGLAELATGDRAAATSRLSWIEAQAEASGDMPEQVAINLLHPDFEAQWIEQWGPVASPLLWSHAMYLLLHDALKEHE